MATRRTTSEKLVILRDVILLNETTYNQGWFVDCIVGIGNRLNFLTRKLSNAESYKKLYEDDWQNSEIYAFAKKFGIEQEDADMLFYGRFARTKGHNHTKVTARNILNRLIKQYEK